MKIEKYQVFHLSANTKLIIRDNHDSIKLVQKRSMGEIMVSLKPEEIQALFNVMTMKDLTEEVTPDTKAEE